MPKRESISTNGLRPAASWSEEAAVHRARPRNRNGSSKQTLRIVVADDTSVYCDGLTGLLSDQPGFEVIDCVSHGRAAIQACEEAKPHLLLCELRLPKVRGADLIEECQAAWPTVKIIGMSRFFDGALVWEAIQAGANGLIAKSGGFVDLCAMIESVYAGEIVLCPAVQDVLVRRAIRNQEHEGSRRLAELTRREREVAQLLVEGRSPKQIALELHVSAKTADSHRYQILRKLGLRNVADLTRLAVREGMTHVDL